MHSCAGSGVLTLLAPSQPVNFHEEKEPTKLLHSHCLGHTRDLSVSQERYPLAPSRTRSRLPVRYSAVPDSRLSWKGLTDTSLITVVTRAIQAFQEVLGTCLQDLRAVGNSRRVHRDVSNVSCRQVPDTSPATHSNRGHSPLPNKRLGWSERSQSHKMRDWPLEISHDRLKRSRCPDRAGYG